MTTQIPADFADERDRLMAKLERLTDALSGAVTVEWEVKLTKRHLPGEDIDRPGTGEEGFGIYLEGHEGYIAWLPDGGAAELVAGYHNDLARAVDQALYGGE